MGLVFRGVDLEHQSLVAIKLIASSELEDVARFAREASILASLQHPAIVRYVFHGGLEDIPYLTMEWLEGETLAERLKHGMLPLSAALEMLRAICEGLAVAHTHGVVHRDLKPSNLFLVGKDLRQPKILDFGLARHSFAPRSLTHSGTLLGTMGYMSPEQAMASQTIDARSDVFALGCVLFECLSGRQAFPGKNAPMESLVLRRCCVRTSHVTCCPSLAPNDEPCSHSRSTT